MFFKQLFRTSHFHIFLIIFGVMSYGQVQAKQYTETSDYMKKSLHGFTILINPEVLKHKKASNEMEKELDSQLAKIVDAVPSRRLSALRKVRIWVEWQAKRGGAAEYHPSAGWLKDNGYNPDKAGSLELSNTRNFISWSRSTQPWIVLHELSHAYHHQVLGDDYKRIETAYKKAINQKLYKSVSYINGGKQRAYAMTNAKEYFAELSESYFGKNDFYPFTYAELEEHDPVGYDLMYHVWGKPKNQ
jgi:hypothetical protein